MLADKPSIRPMFLLCLVITLEGAVWQQVIPGVPDWLAIIGLYSIPMTFPILVVAVVEHVIQAVSHGRFMWSLGRPEVRIAEQHADIARHVGSMNAMQISLYTQILNALALPTRYESDSYININGRDVRVSSIMEYLEGMGPDGSMPPVRNKTREPQRSDFRHLGKTIESGYAVKAASNRGSVQTTKELLHKFIEDANGQST